MKFFLFRSEVIFMFCDLSTLIWLIHDLHTCWSDDYLASVQISESIAGPMGGCWRVIKSYPFRWSIDGDDVFKFLSILKSHVFKTRSIFEISSSAIKELISLSLLYLIKILDYESRFIIVRRQKDCIDIIYWYLILYILMKYNQPLSAVISNVICFFIQIMTPSIILLIEVHRNSPEM